VCVCVCVCVCVYVCVGVCVCVCVCVRACVHLRFCERKKEKEERKREKESESACMYAHMHSYVCMNAMFRRGGGRGEFQTREYVSLSILRFFGVFFQENAMIRPKRRVLSEVLQFPKH